MHKAFLLVLSFLLLALAGCTDGDSTADDLKDEFENQNEGQGGSEGGSGGSEGGSGGGQGGGGEGGEGGSGGEGSEGGEEPGMGAMSISFGAAESVGQAPFAVQFSLLSKAMNPDGTEDMDVLVEWAIFDGENSTSGIDEWGEGREATVNFTFDTPGVYEIAAGVTAEGFESAFATVSINVTAEPPSEPVTQEASGSFVASAGLGCAVFNTAGADPAGFQGSVPINQEIWGGSATIVVTYGGGGLPATPVTGASAYVYDSDGSRTGSAGPVPSGQEMVVDIPAGTVWVFITTCDVGTSADWTFVGTGP